MWHVACGTGLLASFAGYLLALLALLALLNTIAKCCSRCAKAFKFPAGVETLELPAILFFARDDHTSLRFEVNPDYNFASLVSSSFKA